jgi:hypothetical protein
MLGIFDDSNLLEDIVIDDDDLVNNIDLKMSISKVIKEKEINKDLEGEQKDCPKGDKKVIDIIENKEELEIEEVEITDDEIEEEAEITTNKSKKLEEQKKALKDLCKRVIFPVLSLLSRNIRYNDMTFIEIINKIETKELINNIMREKKIYTNNMLNIYDTLNKIMETNQEIINNIREIYRTAPADKIHSLISKHFIPSQDEKKNNAEIPTPIILVDEMLSKIDLKFWTTPKKVFEPCCGKGNFVMRIFDKFYQGLADEYKDIDERCRIIVEECIYYADITILNVFITTEILKCEVESKTGNRDREYKFNFNVGNTLELNIKDKWNFDKFDAVIGNPPYNSNGNNNTGNTIWQNFTKKSLSDWLIVGGFLVFVHPPRWRKPESERSKCKNMFKLMTNENQMLYLEIHNVADGNKIFKCGTRYDWYIIEKVKKYKETIVIDEYKNILNINLEEFEWLPNSNIEIIKDILSKNNNEKCPIIYNRSNYGSDKKWMTDIKTEEFKYTCIHSTPKKSIRYMYSKVNDKGHFGISKVIFGDSGVYNPIIDIIGDYGMTEHCMAIQVNNIHEAKKISKVLLCKKFDEILQSCSWSNYQIDWRLFTYFRRDFYLYFNDEIQPQQLQPQQLQPQQLQPQQLQPQQLQPQQLQPQQLQPQKTKPKKSIEIKNNYTLVELEAINITTLKEIAKLHNIKGITKYKTDTKNILAKLIYDKLNNK